MSGGISHHFQHTHVSTKACIYFENADCALKLSRHIQRINAQQCIILITGLCLVEYGLLAFCGRGMKAERHFRILHQRGL